jgi:GNAT superfamily N-acetyltransferase
MTSGAGDAGVQAILQAYAALWVETDPARRGELIAQCLTEDAEIIGPGYLLSGQRAISDDAARLQREHPTWKPRFASGVDAHSGWCRFAVQVVAGDGEVVARGLDLVEFGAQGRIRRVITFWGALPALTPDASQAAAANAMPALEVHDDVPAPLAALVDAGLSEANERAAPIGDVRRFACLARAPDGTVIGGAVGRTWGECCELQQLWVEAAHRGAGVGARIVRRFEQHAHARGCRTFYLDTFSFQAPAFYRKLGYAPVLEVGGFTPDIVRYTMMKRLDAPA